MEAIKNAPTSAATPIGARHQRPNYQPPGHRHYNMAGPKKKGANEMKTYHKDYGITASIADQAAGTARLIVRDQSGKKMKDSTHSNRQAAFAAWRRMCR